MPKIVQQPKTRAEIQKDSDAKRGVKLASYKFPIEFIDNLKQLAEQHQISQTQILIQAVELWQISKNS